MTLIAALFFISCLYDSEEIANRAYANRMFLSCLYGSEVS